MECIDCNDSPTRVLSTRMTRQGWTRRRRECYSCGFRFYTIEIAEPELDMEKLKEEYDTANSGHG